VADVLSPLSGPQALALLRTVVADCGLDRVDGDTYTLAGAPCCPVGHVLHRHGVTIAQLEEQEGWQVDCLPSAWVDDQARALLTVAQDAADGGWTWAVVLHQVEQRAAELGVT